MREGSTKRETKETAVTVRLNLDGKGQHHIDTGIGFLNHLLESFSVHSQFDLDLTCKGDLFVDTHHTAEDVGIVLGMAFLEALKSKEKIARYGFMALPMDECLVNTAVDISGRPYLVFQGEFWQESIGSLETQMIKEFFYAFAMNARVTLHVNVQYGENDHHKAEAMFKSFAHSLRIAVSEQGSAGILSTKGSLG